MEPEVNPKLGAPRIYLSGILVVLKISILVIFMILEGFFRGLDFVRVVGL